MLCWRCRKAGDLKKYGEENATKWHNLCEYPESCTCQHSVKDNVIAVAEIFTDSDTSSQLSPEKSEVENTDLAS
jgi:hypothetical protein